LFMFFMLILVMAANYLLLFVGWEGVGLSSYLLIGFYFLRKSASDAGKKAFIVNRIGDFGFLLGMFLLFREFGTLDFVPIFSAAAGLQGDAMGQVGILTAICLLLFVGATGKSAQVPLYVWLPDAMEGPTPVSALIHAATMVTAGVYVVARSGLLYMMAPTALTVVAVIGVATALFAATIGLAQNDIKRVLAYSTVSQLGYMFLACGVGAFAAAVFHLFTHAFFKALLFLGAGSVIHAMGGEQDMRKMGGLRSKIPVTFWTMLMGTLAIAGAPLFSGFFSKDAILFAAATSPYGGKVLWGVAFATAVLTAVYMFRLIFLTFFGAPRYDQHKVHVHESPKSMLVPLVILALLSVGGGWMAAPHLFGGTDHFEEFLSPVFHGAEELLAAAPAEKVRTPEELHTLELILAGGAVFGAAIGALIAWRRVLGRRPSPLERAAPEAAGGLTRLLENKYYIDEIYDAVIVRPLQWVSTHVLWRVMDAGLIDGTANGLAGAARSVGGQLRRMQSGNTRSYAAWVVVGVVFVTSLLLWWVS
ncbi:MAG TPA: NADH-quinone oxidoreductase subunit L, partial [Candidatus Acidoferrales bacterium]